MVLWYREKASQRLKMVSNPVFRATRIEMGHPALAERDLTPQGYIELTP